MSKIVVVTGAAINTPQFDWALNKMSRKARPVAPVFQPAVAARAIRFAAEHDRRDVWVGYSTVQAILANRIAPSLVDWHLARTGYAGQLTDKLLPVDTPNNLFDPVPGDYPAHGRFDASAKPASWQMFTDRHRTAFWGAPPSSPFLVFTNWRNASTSDDRNEAFSLRLRSFQRAG